MQMREYADAGDSSLGAISPQEQGYIVTAQVPNLRFLPIYFRLTVQIVFSNKTVKCIIISIVSIVSSWLCAHNVKL